MMLSRVPRQTSLASTARKSVAKQTVEIHRSSQRTAYRCVQISRSYYQYQPTPDDDPPEIYALGEHATLYPEHGFDQLFLMPGRMGVLCNPKRVRPVYRLLRLHLRSPIKKRIFYPQARGFEIPYSPTYFDG